MSRYTDGFTDTDGVLLENHASTDFGGWEKDTGYAPDGFTIQSNRLDLNDATGTGWADKTTGTVTLPTTGFAVYFDLLGIGDAGLWTRPLTVYLALLDATETTGWTLQLYYEDHGGSPANQWTIQVYDTTLASYPISQDVLATALSAIGPHRLGFEFAASGTVKLFREPVYGGPRTYLRDEDGVLVEGAYSTGLLGSARKVILNATAFSATSGWLDNLTIDTGTTAEALATPRGGSAVYNDQVTLARVYTARQYALRFGLGGYGRWQRIAVVHGATTGAATSDQNYFALYGLEVNAVAVKQRTDAF